MSKTSRLVEIRKKFEERTKAMLAEADRLAREQLDLLGKSRLEDEFEPEATVILPAQDDDP